MLFNVSLGLMATTLFTAVSAVDMKFYEPASGVEAEFEAYVQALYAQTEIPASTTGFTDSFTTDGQLIVRGIVATGATEILALKQKLMPLSGEKHWNHMPGAASVYETTSTTKTYDVQGNIQTTYDGGNCSSAAYSTHFTVALDTAGNPKFTTGSLSLYDDYLIDPSVSPTSIECVA